MKKSFHKKTLNFIIVLKLIVFLYSAARLSYRGEFHQPYNSAKHKGLSIRQS
jgi:hypothetical protein